MVAYLCKSKDGALVRSSSSGGVFTHLARAVLEQGGAVFGSVYDGEKGCRHVRAESEEELAALRGSKYLRSDLNDTFRQAQEILGQNRPVLFTGTPCQIAKLAAKVDHPKLVTADLICHGVPETKVWDIYLARFSSKPLTANFRDKTEGWRNYSLRLAFPDGSVYRKNRAEDPFLRAYGANLCLREACHQCLFNTLAKRADITLGDDWRPQKTDDGTSVVLVHTPKGEALFALAADGLHTEKAEFAAIAAANQALLRPSVPHPKRESFLASVTPENFDTLVAQYTKLTVYEMFLKILKKLFTNGGILSRRRRKSR
ncbi:MAG: Coenzyme F420 hydrogenase/dehydrogenase, beta subunit C-terminal domain [Oscillospiraceae bacterium]|jgi:coenzyme F420-reducing hydrogenase beta subunit|nr:Coenzyme F420 hydrogenase/dehydrogenase, beta subunit C-terminal domain [Oscillospiraceae bacterium]